MTGMRLVIATPLYSPESGGPATYAALLEEGLPHHGVEVGVVDKDAPEQIARAVEDICARLEEVTRVIAHARAMVEEKYRWDFVTRKMKEVFDRITEKG